MTADGNRVALVTGAGSGIGRATALRFAVDGWRVVVSDIREAGASEVAAEIRRRGGEALAFRADVSRPDDVEALIGQCIGEWGRLDAAFNNAGMEGDTASTVDCSESNWDRTIAVNLKGVWLCMKHELPHMVTRGKGAIVNCSSVAGLVGFAGLPAYTASKHGVIGLTRTAALEYAAAGIRINAVCPGAVATPMLDRVMASGPDVRARLLASEPVGRIGMPEEIAGAVAWLCSDDASFVTGHALAADGGWVAR